MDLMAMQKNLSSKRISQ